MPSHPPFDCQTGHRIERPLRAAQPQKVVAWNVCSGGGERIEAIIGAIDSLDASIVVLTEITAARHDQWSAALSVIGLLHQSNTTNHTSRPEPYSVIIASRGPQELHPWRSTAPFLNRALRVTVGGVSITGLLAPDDPRPARPFWHWLRGESVDPVSSEAMLIGDFNVDQFRSDAALVRCLTPLIDDGWVDGLRALDSEADHTSWWGSTAGFAIDNALLSRPTAARLDRAEMVARINGTTTAAAGLRVSDGALSDHRPILIALRHRDGTSHPGTTPFLHTAHFSTSRTSST